LAVTSAAVKSDSFSCGFSRLSCLPTWLIPDRSDLVDSQLFIKTVVLRNFGYVFYLGGSFGFTFRRTDVSLAGEALC
jgi:hypothetical protein